MINYIKSKFPTKNLIWNTWVISFAIYILATGLIEMYQSTYDGAGWASAGTSDIMLFCWIMLWFVSQRVLTKYRALMAQIFEGWDNTLADNKTLVKRCAELQKENEELKKEKV